MVGKITEEEELNPADLYYYLGIHMVAIFRCI